MKRTLNKNQQININQENKEIEKNILNATIITHIHTNEPSPSQKS